MLETPGNNNSIHVKKGRRPTACLAMFRCLEKIIHAAVLSLYSASNCSKAWNVQVMPMVLLSVH